MQVLDRLNYGGCFKLLTFWSPLWYIIPRNSLEQPQLVSMLSPGLNSLTQTSHLQKDGMGLGGGEPRIHTCYPGDRTEGKDGARSYQ